MRLFGLFALSGILPPMIIAMACAGLGATTTAWWNAWAADIWSITLATGVLIAIADDFLGELRP